MAEYIGLNIGGTFLKGAVLDTTRGELRHTIRSIGADLNITSSREYVLSPRDLVASARQMSKELYGLFPRVREY